MIETSEVRVDLGGDGTLSIPYANVVGEAGDGPHLTVIAGVHGTEYTSIAAARELIAELRPAELSGTVTVAPLINLPAFWARSPFVVPLDGQNLNRSFPGDPRGSAAGRIAAAVTERLIKGSDYLIDLHAGDLPEALEPFVFYDASPVEQQPVGADSRTRRDEERDPRGGGGNSCRRTADDRRDRAQEVTFRDGGAGLNRRLPPSRVGRPHPDPSVVLGRAVEHDGLAGKQSQMAEDVAQPAKMPVDGVPGEDAALSRLGGE
jgi:hypothetical protein